jgi:acetolactate synthase small subunit
MLGKVKQLLEGTGISQARIDEAYQMIKGSGRYIARMPSHYMAIAIELIEMDWHRPGGVKIYISPQATKYALGRPSVTFAVLALDWPGLVNSCTGTMHEKGFNIAFCEAVIIDEPDRKVGLVFMEIEVGGDEEFNHLVEVEPEIKETLIRAAAQETGKRELLIMETRKAEQYSLVVDELKKICTEEELPAFFGEKGEAVRFFAARTLAYLTERHPEDLAHQIYTNYSFIKTVRDTSKICAEVGNITTPAGELTGTSVAGFEHDLSMGDSFRVIDGVVPGYQRKYDKAFITGDGVNVFRIEFVDAKGRALPRDQRLELSRKLREIKDAPACDRLSPGVELIGRKICPIMLEEERQLTLPQVYMHPHSRTNIKLVLVASGEDRGQAFNLIESIGRVRGLEAAMPDPPSVVSYGSDGERRPQEVAIIDVWVDFEAFFGTSKGPYNDELILVRIEKAIRKADSIGPRLRIFDRTGRQLRRARSEKITSMARKRGFDPEIAREILARLGDKQIVSPTVADEEVLSQVMTGIEAVDAFHSSEDSAPGIVWRDAEHGSTGRGSSYTILGVAHTRREQYLSELVSMLGSFGLESSTVVDGNDYTLLVFRLVHQGKSLEEEEIQDVVARIRKALGGTPQQ